MTCTIPHSRNQGGDIDDWPASQARSCSAGQIVMDEYNSNGKRCLLRDAREEG